MFSIVSFSELASTNDHLKQHNCEYPFSTVILAQHQTKGRGRFERIWQSDQDLTFSILFPHGPNHGFIAPLAVVKALKAHAIPAEIKWPNDVLVHGKKVCGILVESVYEGNDAVADIVGIGVNVTEKKNLRAKSTYVSLSRNELLTDILARYEELLGLETKDLLNEIRKVFYLNGKTLQIDGIMWDVDGVDEHGYLCIHHQDQQRILKSEEITLSSIYEKEQS